MVQEPMAAMVVALEEVEEAMVPVIYAAIYGVLIPAVNVWEEI